MTLLGKAYPDGFAARLAAEDSMAFLTPIAASEGGDALYAVKR
jgi:hypothetical protein